MSNLPDIEVMNSTFNPIIYSPNSEFFLPFYQSRETFQDVEVYKKFLDNAIRQFRQSRTYKSIKSNLMSHGLDRCQVHGNITDDMAKLEMHHCILTIFDIALLITEHTINTIGYISTFDLIKKLKEEHKLNNVPLTMLSKTPHQLYHNTDNLYIPPNMIFGNWYELLKKYNYGITKEIAYKIIYYINEVIDKGDCADDNHILDIRDSIMNWSTNNDN